MWLEKVNRGGLFELNDAAYNFFLEIEKHTRFYLRSLYQNPEQKSVILQRLKENEDILFYWSLISVDVDDRHSPELLQDILDHWLTIRGFSITGCWLEQYKRIRGKSSKCEPALRKGLKKKQI